MRGQSGVTLMEALIVVTIIGILAAFGFPAMTKFLQTQAVRSASYDLFADLVFARSEAISRGTTVSIIGNSTTDWKQGWVIRENGGGSIIRTQSARSATINFTASQADVTFDRSGRASANMTFNIVPVDATTNVHMKRCIRLDPSGRPKSAEGSCV